MSNNNLLGEMVKGFKGGRSCDLTIDNKTKKGGGINKYIQKRKLKKYERTER